MSGLRLLVTVGILFLGTAPSIAYTIVLTNGHRVEATSTPISSEGRVIFNIPGGARVFVSEDLFDGPATEVANAGLIQGDNSWKYEELSWWKDFSYRQEEKVVQPPLGSIAPGGQSQDSYDASDLTEGAAEALAESPVDREDLARRIVAAQKLHLSLKSEYEKLGAELSRIESELSVLKEVAEPTATAEARLIKPEAPRFELIPFEELTAETSDTP